MARRGMPGQAGNRPSCNRAGQFSASMNGNDENPSSDQSKAHARFALAIVSLVAATLPSSAYAQAQAAPPPDPSVINNQTLEQQRREVKALEAPSNDAPAVTGSREEDNSPAADNSVSFKLRDVQFDRSKYLSADALDQIALPFISTEVTFADLGAITDGVNALYDQRGLVTARAVLLPQTIEGGKVRVSLIEGVIGKVEVATADTLSAEEAIDRSGVTPGETLDPKKLERRLSLINRTNPVQIRAGLKPGEQFGLTDIQLAITAPKADLLQLFVDNYGFDSAGQLQGGGFYRRRGLVGASDRLSIYGSASEGNVSGTISYDAAVFGPTTRLGVSYGRSRSEIVNGPFAEISSVGKTQNWSINYSQPIASSSRGLLLGSLTAGLSETRNFVSDEFLNQVTTKKAGAGLSYSYLAPGTNLQAAVNALIARAPLTVGVDKETYGLFSGNLSAEKQLSSQYSIRAIGGWQLATSNSLPGDSTFQIGGAFTVRGYEQGGLSGDEGYYFNLEIENRMTEALGLFAFFDNGRVSSVRDQPKSLSALGLGLNFAAFNHFSIRGTAGWPLRRLPGQTKSPQVFARATLQF